MCRWSFIFFGVVAVFVSLSLCRTIRVNIMSNRFHSFGASTKNKQINIFVCLAACFAVVRRSHFQFCVHFSLRRCRRVVVCFNGKYFVFFEAKYRSLLRRWKKKSVAIFLTVNFIFDRFLNLWFQTYVDLRMG